MSAVLFNREDCSYIKSYWNKENSSGSTKYLRFSLDSGQTINFRTKVSGSYIDIIDNKEFTEFFLSKVASLGIKSISTGFKLAKYSIGDYFEPHHDFNYYGNGALYKTLVIHLSDPSTYEGGDLYVKDERQTREQGSFSLFLSSDLHEVKKVITGERWSLTTFLLESDFHNTKTLL